MGSVDKIKVNDIVFHTTPSGIKYIGIVKAISGLSNTGDIAWYTVPNGKYFMNSPADLSRVELIGPMPEGAEW